MEEEARTKNSSAARRCAVALGVHVCSHVGLVGLVVGYALLGALLFEFLEADHEIKQHGRIQASRDDCLRELWTITERLNVLYERNWTRLVHEQLRKFESNVVAATRHQGYDGKEILDKGRQWSFGGALLYSVTVITTIGYGNLAPKTPTGKVVTMAYATIGVPLMLLCLSNLGQLLAHAVQELYIRIRYKYHTTAVPGGGHGPGPSKHYSHRYQRAPTSPNKSCASLDSSMIQLHEICEIPKKTVLATVNANHTRGRCRLSSRPVPGEVRHLLRECPEHSPRHIRRQELVESEETEDTDDNDNSSCPAHDTPSRIPLIWKSEPQHKPQSATPPPSSAGLSPMSVGLLVSCLLACYVCLGAAAFATWENWSFLDAAYFCFVTLATIGFGDLVPGRTFPGGGEPGGQAQMVACSAYLVVGLILVAMSFSLVQEEVSTRCRQLVRNVRQ